MAGLLEPKAEVEDRFRITGGRNWDCGCEVVSADSIGGVSVLTTGIVIGANTVSSLGGDTSTERLFLYKR